MAARLSDPPVDLHETTDGEGATATLCPDNINGLLSGEPLQAVPPSGAIHTTSDEEVGLICPRGYIPIGTSCST